MRQAAAAEVPPPARAAEGARRSVRLPQVQTAIRRVTEVARNRTRNHPHRNLSVGVNAGHVTPLPHRLTSPSPSPQAATTGTATTGTATTMAATRTCRRAAPCYAPAFSHGLDLGAHPPPNPCLRAVAPSGGCTACSALNPTPSRSSSRRRRSSCLSALWHKRTLKLLVLATCHRSTPHQHVLSRAHRLCRVPMPRTQRRAARVALAPLTCLRHHHGGCGCLAVVQHGNAVLLTDCSSPLKTRVVCRTCRLCSPWQETTRRSA